jgi:hypothetical protein
VAIVRARVVDSTDLELAQPLAATQGEEIPISIAEPGDDDTERQEWIAASLANLSRAYGDSEPDYSSYVVKEKNESYCSPL